MPPKSSEMVTKHPDSGVTEFLPPRGIDVESFTVFWPGWSVISPSTTSISGFSLIAGTNILMQLPDTTNNKKRETYCKIPEGKYFNNIWPAESPHLKLTFIRYILNQ